MRVSSFEPNNGEYYEFYDLREAKREAKKFAKELNKEIYLTQVMKPSYAMNWFIVFPDGKVICTDRNLRL
jgi:hypothetical protein